MNVRILLLTITALVYSAGLKAQWSNTGDNNTTGNLFIGSSGTTSEKFRVSADGTQRAAGMFGATGTGNAGIYFDASNGDFIGSDYASLLQIDSDLSVELSNAGANPIFFKTGGSKRLSILGNGYVGIGTTTPSRILELEGGDDVGLRLFNNTANYWEVINSNLGRLDFIRGGVNHMRIDQVGNIGIGTTSPGAKLDVNGTILATTEIGLSGTNPGFLFAESDVTDKNWHMQVNSGDFKLYEVNDARSVWNQKVVVKNGTGYVGIGSTAPDMHLTVEGNLNVGGTANGTIKARHLTGKSHTGTGWGDLYIQYHTSAPIYVGTTANPANMYMYGNMGIGTTSPTEKLEVNGTIRSKEVKVEASPWPDYVFESNYDLPTLGEIEKFIQSNGHLPEVPSAEEVEEEGIALGEMNALLLKKIEELTLYQIQLLKRVDELTTKVNKLQETTYQNVDPKK